MTKPIAVACVVLATIAALVLVATSALRTTPLAVAPVADPAPPVSFSFISSPDFLNADVGTLRDVPGWDGAQDSTNPDWDAALDHVLDTWAAQAPDCVLVAGDTVEGHWGRNFSGDGYFGRYGTAAARSASIRLAAATYYRQWRSRFTSRGLVPHVAIGDHEIGDNPWTDRLKRAAVPVYKRAFAQRMVAPNRYRMHPEGPAGRTAYARYLAPEVLLVSVDVFDLTPSDVRARLDRRQLRWLDTVLSGAKTRGTDWIIVQGHVPVLGPVRERASSGLRVEGGARSGLWRTMAKYDVDLYLSGEVHDVTTRRRDGITQISHGGIFPNLTSWLHGRVIGDKLYLTINQFGLKSSRPDDGALWGNDPRKAPGREIDLRTDRDRESGALVLTQDNQVVAERGQLRVYRGSTPPGP